MAVRRGRFGVGGEALAAVEVGVVVAVVAEGSCRSRLRFAFVAEASAVGRLFGLDRGRSDGYRLVIRSRSLRVLEGCRC